MQDNLEFLKKLKALEIAFKKHLVTTGSIQPETLLKLIPTDKGFTHAVLFIEDNNIQPFAHAITLRMALSRNIDTLTISEKRTKMRNEIFDMKEDYDSNRRSVEAFEDMIWMNHNDFQTYRIKIEGTSLFLSGYNDYINEKTMEKGLFPVWSEQKFKMYSSIDKALYTIGVMKKEHPNLKAVVS